ncbi:transmembrane proteins 14C-domain-containing protein, partial [Naematelia encephala]
YTGYVYAGMLVLGGLMGFRRRRSLISLIMGTLSGILAGYGAYKVSNDGHDVYVGLAVSWGLCAIMGYRAVVTEKFMPAGLGTSVLLLINISF